jgi:hypothetical protein
VTDTPLDELLARSDPAWAPLARQIDRLITGVAPQLMPRLAYGMLVYSLGTDKAAWIVAVDVRPRVVVVRFLAGTLLDDPRHLLRGGTSTLMNLDLASPEALDPAALQDLVRQAVARYPDYKALRSVASRPGSRAGD